MTPVGMKIFMIRKKWISKSATTKPTTKSKVTVWLRTQRYQMHFDMQHLICGQSTCNNLIYQFYQTSPTQKRLRTENQQRQNAIIDDWVFPQLQVTMDEFTRFLTLSTISPLKSKRKRLNFPKDFGELNMNGLINMRALSDALARAELGKIRILAPHTIFNEGLPPEFQFMIGIGQ